MKTLVLVVTFFISCWAVFNPSSYSNNITLLPNQYNLYWTIQGDTILLALQVQTLGWVGFGLGEPTSGSMPGGDIITAQVINGVTQIQDRHAIIKDTPIIDDCQDWVLINGEENNGWTTVEVSRKLNTSDVQDRPITGLNRIIFAFGATDVVSYHGANRYFTAVTFFGPQPTSLVLGDPSVQTSTFLNLNYTIPAVDTTYQEVPFLNLPLSKDVHIVRLESVIDPIGKPYVHHFLLYACLNTTCSSVLWAWAPGVDPFELPKEAGYRMGPGGWNGFMMQIHYNNPTFTSGIVDNSGIKVYYTSNIRQFDAGVLELGDPLITQKIPIPQGTGVSFYEYNCPSECTSTFGENLIIFADFLHMHQIGDMMWSTLWRNGTNIGYLNRIEYWDFAFQQTTTKNLTLYPGDRINTHCKYDQNPATKTVFSIASQDEMCLEYVYYYPRLNGSFCSFIFEDGKNLTACLNSVLLIDGAPATNPTVTDPPGGEIKTFGATNPNSFQCAGTAFTAQTLTAPTQNSQTSTAVQHNSSAVQLILEGITLLALLFIAF